MATQTKDTPKIADWPAFDVALGQVRELDAQGRKFAAQREDAMRRTAEHWNTLLDDVAARRAPLAKAIGEFCKRRRPDFGERQSLRFDNGEVGWRLGNPRVEPLSKQVNPRQILINICRAGRRFRHFLRAIVELAKGRVLDDHREGKITDAELAALGLRVIQTERFYIDTEVSEPRNRQMED